MAGKDKAVDLAQATNALNEALRDAEAYFQSLDLGVTATVGLALTGALTDVRLGFGKLNQRWTLYALYRDGSSEPIISASRGARVAAAKALFTLETALRTQVKTEAEKVAAAAETAAHFLDQRRNG